MKKFLLLIFLLSFALGRSQGAAPGDPGRNSWDVISLFSGAYTNLPGTNFNPFWGQTNNHPNNMTTPSYGGDEVRQYQNTGSYQGTETQSDVNVSAMTRFHIEIYSSTLTSIRLSLIKITAGTVEIPTTLPLVPGQWNVFDIDISGPAFAAIRPNFRQIKYDQPAGAGNIQNLIVDNLFFWRPATLQPPTVGTFTVPAQSVGAAPFTLTPPTSNNTSPFTYTSSNTAVATISGNTVTVVGAGTSTITALQVSDGIYGPSSTPATLTVSFPAPGPSPTPPLRNPGSVISMYTGTPIETSYPNPVGFNMIRAPWTAGSITSDLNFPNGTNTCIRLDNFGFFGFVSSAEPVRFSVVGMTKLHVDIYLNTPIANMFVFLLSNGDQLYNTGPLVAGWNSLDINLSAYPGANLASIYGFKFEHNQPGLRQIYLDNIYFYNGGTEPTITDFNMPEKVFGDAPFTITPPTSNSAGAFTYSSNNPSVATVSGNTITITGIGTATITASQAADGIYDAGSITAPLVVAAPPLTTPAPTPPARNPWDVISLYSNAYSNVPSVAWQGVSALSDEVLAGDDTKKMSNFLIELVNFAGTNVSQMTTLHMDIYTTDCTGFNIWLLNNGDRNAQFFPTLNTWFSVDIPLSTYANNGLNLANIIQLKFESLNGPGKTVYVDNIYFYRPATLLPPTVGSFSVPAKNVGDATFTITPPTSNNTNPFTYTSSNTNVATIVNGNQIQIVSGGTTTITASQAQDGTYGPSSSTALFVVNFPPPGPSPIPPARDPDTVISMYTGTPSTYANPVGYTMIRAPWTAATTLTEIPNGTNTCLRVDNLGFLGYVTSTEPVRFSVVGMTHLHLDVYVNTAFSNLFFWLLTDGDQRRDIVDLQPGWNSITIDLNEFSGANLSNVYGFKFEQNQPGPLQIYLDNIYFSNDTYYMDADGDGFGNPASPVIGQQIGAVMNDNDCDDTRASVRPGAPEVCFDGLDNDCNGVIDNIGQPGGCTPIVSTIPTATCGTEVAFGGIVYSSWVTGAQGYRFRVTEVNPADDSEIPGTQVIVDMVLRNLYLHNLSNYKYNAKFKVEVAVRFNNVWQPTYSAPCFLLTPTPVSSMIGCGTQVTGINTQIFSTIVQRSNGYRYRIQRLDNALQPAGPVQEITSGIRNFTFASVTDFRYDANYSVSCAVRNTDGSFLPYGSSCTIQAPKHPTTQVRGTQCNDYAVTSYSERISADAVQSAAQYRFRLFNEAQAYNFQVDRVLNNFRLSDFPGLVAGENYSVQVAVRMPNQLDFGPYSKTCTLVVPSIARTIEDTSVTGVAFDAQVYPNPYAEQFYFKVTTASQASFTIQVYDMMGRAIETRTVNADAIESTEVGATYPSGIYNVILTQGNDIKSLRVIKR